MKEKWFRAFEDETRLVEFRSLYRNTNTKGHVQLQSIHPKHTLNPPKDTTQLWDFPSLPNSLRYYIWPRKEAQDNEWHQNTWEGHRDSFYREKARAPADVWSRTKLARIMRTRVRKYKRHPYIAFDIERPGSLISTITEADFPYLNQHDLETIIRWLKTTKNLGVPNKLALKRVHQFVFEMLQDFSIDYELADLCKIDYTLKPKTYKKKLSHLTPGIINGVGILYEAEGELRLSRINDKHMYPTTFLETMIQFMSDCF